MDRNEPEFRAGEAAECEPTGEASSPVVVASRSDELFRQGEEHFAAGRYQLAIHLWTRILFVDRGNLRARAAIDEAKGFIAERQRRLDVECAEAARELESGDADGARSRIEAVLATDPGHVEARHLHETLSALDRRGELEREPGPEVLSDRGASKGIVLRVPRGERTRPEAGRPADSRLKMIAFLATAGLVFAASALYLYDNWESIVTDGEFRHPTAAESTEELTGPVVPDLAELRYYNGARLFEQGRYREALAELGRIDRGSHVTAEARSLILRIEERLLRSAPGDEDDAAEASPGVDNEAGAPPEPSLAPRSTGSRAREGRGEEVPK